MNKPLIFRLTAVLGRLDEAVAAYEKAIALRAS